LLEQVRQLNTKHLSDADAKKLIKAAKEEPKGNANANANADPFAELGNPFEDQK